MAIERDRAWRRFTSHVKKGKGMGSKEDWKPEKNWKMVNFRSEKLVRARQLGFDYPKLSTRQLLDKNLP